VMICGRGLVNFSRCMSCCGGCVGRFLHQSSLDFPLPRETERRKTPCKLMMTSLILQVFAF
jgi:hypothetical protein